MCSLVKPPAAFLHANSVRGETRGFCFGRNGEERKREGKMETEEFVVLRKVDLPTRPCCPRPAPDRQARS